MDFVLAGRAVFTVSNNKGEHFTFKIMKAKDSETLYFANVLSGGNGIYTYMGIFDNHSCKVVQGKKGISPEAKSVKVLEWAIKVIKGESPLPNDYNIQHEGACGRCGKSLTDNISLEIGLGPYCRTK